MANFVEQATLQLNDKSSAKINKINAALARLYATANKINKIKVDIKGVTQSSSQVRKLTNDLARLAATQARVSRARQAVARMPAQRAVDFKSPRRVPDATIQSINRLAAAVGRYSSALSSIPSRNLRLPAVPAPGAVGRTRMPIPAAGGGGGRVPIIPRTRNNGLPNGASFGRQVAAGWNAAMNPFNVGARIASGFLGSIGGQLHNALAGAVRDSVRSGGRGIVTADDARAMAAGSGIQDVNQFSNIAAESSRKFKGTSGGEIMAAATEQVASLQNQLSKGKITNDEYAASVAKVTDRIARNSQIFTTSGQAQEQAAESARQQEKALVLLGTGQGQATKDIEKFNDAILQAQIGVGGDIGSNEVKRLLQQLSSSVVAQLSPAGIQNAIIARDEGGARSTAEIRMFMQGLQRINKTDKALAAQREQGIRKADDTTAFSAKELADPVAVVLDQMIPRLEKLGVNLDDATAVNAALQRSLGLTQSEAAFPTAQVVNRNSLLAERERIQRVNPETLAQQQTLRVEMADVEAQFQNVAVSFTKALLPAVKGSLDLVSSSLEGISKEGPTAGNIAGLSAGALGIGLTAGMKAMLDPATAPLGAAGLSLTASAAALTGSAAALTASAAVGGAADIAGGGKKGPGMWALLLTRLAPVLGAAAVLSSPNNPVSKEDFEKDELAKSMRITLDQINSSLVLNKEMKGPIDPRVGIEADTALIRKVMAIESADAATRPMQGPMPVKVVESPAMPSPLSRPGAGELATVQPLAIAEAPNKMGEVFTSGMDRFAVTFQTGGATMQQGLITGGAQAAASLLGAGPSVGAAIAAQLQAVGPAIGASIAAAIKAATSSINVNVNAQSGATLPGPARADTGAQEPI